MGIWSETGLPLAAGFHGPIPTQSAIRHGGWNAIVTRHTVQRKTDLLFLIQNGKESYEIKKEDNPAAVLFSILCIEIFATELLADISLESLTYQFLDLECAGLQIIVFLGAVEVGILHTAQLNLGLGEIAFNIHSQTDGQGALDEL